MATTYQNFIDKLRREAKDRPQPMHNDFTGDGVTTIFVVTDGPILEDSYVITVNSSQVDEGDDYTIDIESGVITFAVAPSNNHAITIDYKYVHLTNASWIDCINYVIEDMEGDFWKEVDDTDFEDSVVDSVSYYAPTKCIDVINWWYKTSDNSSVRWSPVSEFSNWRFNKDQLKMSLGRPFTANGYPTRLHYLAGYTLGTTAASNIDVQDEYHLVLQQGCMWRYYDYRLAERVEITTKVSKERTITPLQNLQALSRHYYQIYAREKGRKKPTKPSRILNPFNQSGGQA